MKRSACRVLSLAAAVVLSGCAAATTPVTGFLYSDVKGPHHATSNETASKHGTGEAVSWLGWIGTGDASIDSAAKKAGITKVHHVDYETYSILGIYAKFTVHVYGE